MNRPMPTAEKFHADRGIWTPGPQGPVHVPREGWWKPAGCKDINCELYLKGWTTVVPATSAQWLYDIRHHRWEFTETPIENGLIAFMFAPGQTCYKHLTGTGHLVPVERDPVFVHKTQGHQRIYDYDQWHYTFNGSSYARNQRIKEG